MEEQVTRVLNNSDIEPKLAQEILTIGRLKKVKAGGVVISPESNSNEMPIVLEGLLKVMRRDEERGDIFLYYIGGGETCAMSITCCIEGKKKEFHVVAEEDSILWMIPMTFIDSWIVKYKSFRRYVFDSYQTRFEEMLNTIDSVVFLNMHERLFKYLLDKKQATGSYVINKTHEQIAQELNTSRVVVSRLLKQLEKEEKIEQHRNRIEIL
ncbi:MAG: Crp/Fnr family transcriptional regulator [Flammeovirgaceae bacterium]|nr:Crp/Fnr family transcriptional regulator [Flammeovirgaceae bacterium]MBE62266.1 Crp/Fnr family transcriptional regulator [Flammeovirgaceae bacterium]MBR10563.1 Crp/Fnr family transcriptional regulator [Rickettsiales bacterium]HCX22901.1 Crp/Fnr family transcriptional regulator [Cytophagales bacterium]